MCYACSLECHETLTAGDVHGVFFELGSHKHLCEPTRAKRLRWVLKDGQVCRFL